MPASMSLPAALWSSALALGLALAPFTAWAQVQSEGDYVLRASTVSAAELTNAMRTEHNIPDPPHTAVLNVTVQRKSNGALLNIPARLDVRIRNLLGVETAVDMRPVVANELISYLGVYFFLPREVLDIQVTAQPEGAQQT
jgi:hypothetical protein